MTYYQLSNSLKEENSGHKKLIRSIEMRNFSPKQEKTNQKLWQLIVSKAKGNNTEKKEAISLILDNYEKNPSTRSRGFTN